MFLINKFKNPKLETVLDEWYNVHVIDLADSTAYEYTISIRQYKAYFGDTRIKDVRFDLLQTYLLYLKNERKLATKTIHNRMKGLSLCLKYAVKAGYIKKNPLDVIEVPTGRTKTEKVPFNEVEMEKLLEQDFIPWVKDAVVICYHTGMRPGEIYGLKWSDINFKQSFIMVQRSLSRGGCKAVIKTTKTECGVRRIDIDSYLLGYLMEMKIKSDSIYVFSMPDNSHYRIPWNLSKRFKEMCIKAGVVPRDFYTLRHTHATMLLANGVHSKIMQERLGHSDISITMSTYSHVTPTIQKEAVKIFENKKVPVCGKQNLKLEVLKKESA